MSDPQKVPGQTDCGEKPPAGNVLEGHKTSMHPGLEGHHDFDLPAVKGRVGGSRNATNDATKFDLILS